MSVIIGVDPHKSTHTVVAIDRDERPFAGVQLVADRCQTQRLLAGRNRWARSGLGRWSPLGGWASCWPSSWWRRVSTSLRCPRPWPRGFGYWARPRRRSPDSNVALATAIAGLWHCGLRAVRVEDHTAVLGMLIDRDDDLVALRTQAACRLHVAPRQLIAGGAPRRLGASRATKLLRNIHPQGAAGLERKRLAVELLADLCRFDRGIAGAKHRVSDAVTATGTSLLELHGVGPIVAGFILGHVGDPARFATPERLAPYNGTAPIEASSGPHKRLNPRGNRKLNHALHLAAVTQVRHDTPGRTYHQPKIADGKSNKDALRALKRRISDAVWRQLQVDLGRR
jgi:transposase